jgi:hypothetical protein
MSPDSAASASSELAPQAQNYSRHNHKYERYKCGVDYRCYDGYGRACRLRLHFRAETNKEPLIKKGRLEGGHRHG